MTSISPSNYAQYIDAFPSLLSFVHISLLNVQSGYTSRSKMPDLESVNNVVSRTLSMFNLNIRSKLHNIEEVSINNHVYKVLIDVESKYKTGYKNFERLSFLTTICNTAALPYSSAVPLVKLRDDVATNVMKYFNNNYSDDTSYSMIHIAAFRIDRYLLNIGSYHAYLVDTNDFIAFQNARYEMYKDINTLAGINVSMRRELPEDMHNSIIEQYPNVASSDNRAFTYDISGMHHGRLESEDEHLYSIRQFNCGNNKFTFYTAFIPLGTNEAIDAIKNYLATGTINRIANGGFSSRFTHAFNSLLALEDKNQTVYIAIHLRSPTDNLVFILSNKHIESLADIVVGYDTTIHADINQNIFLDKDALSYSLNEITSIFSNFVLTRVLPNVQ